MRRSLFATFLVATTIVLTAVSISTAQKRPRRKMKAPVFTPVAKVHDLMALNKQLFQSLQGNLQGESPDWETAGHEARLLGEIANVLQYHKPTSVKEWWSFAGTYGDGIKQLITAAEAKDAKAAIGKHAALFTSCKQCHEKYRQ